jgi:hypothetical protein
MEGAASRTVGGTLRSLGRADTADERPTGGGAQYRLLPFLESAEPRIDFCRLCRGGRGSERNVPCDADAIRNAYHPKW